MIKRPFGWTNVEVPVIGQGTWMIEGDPDREKRAVETLRWGLDLGLTHIDTAEMYGEGRVAQLVAEAIVGRPETPRRQALLACLRTPRMRAP